MALGPPGRTGRDQLAAARDAEQQGKPGPRDIVVVGCAWSAAENPIEQPGVFRFDVACVGNLHTSTVEFLVRSGAGGVLIVSCPARDCRGREGRKWLHQRLFEGREAELKERVDRQRIRVIEASAADAAHLERSIVRFKADIARMAIADGEDNVDLIALCDEPAESVIA
jgi:coenzyme F420-reducing hydrogenase delta subunit